MQTPNLNVHTRFLTLKYMDGKLVKMKRYWYYRGEFPFKLFPFMRRCMSCPNLKLLI